MFYKDSVTAAANYLKQAIPRMVGLGSPANPVNYTLWYNYVSQRLPALNRAMDKLLEDKGEISPAHSRDLYQRHVLVDYFGEPAEQTEDLSALAAALLNQLDIVAKGSDELDQVLQENVSKIQSSASLVDVTTLISAVVNSANAMSDKNAEFKVELARATEEIDSLQRQLEEAQRFANFDGLTQVYNRRAFSRELQHLIEQSDKSSNICLILIDLDHFKAFNDNYGHTMGDHVLQKSAQLIQAFCPEQGMAARFGGEEFALILNGSNLVKAIALSESLCQRIRRLRVKIRTSNEYLQNITASFGVAQYQYGETMESLIDRADKALYQAKETGRDCVRAS